MANRRLKSIRKKSEYKRVFEGGRKRTAKHAVAFILKSSETRLGVITKKKLGSAVKRNLIRRRIKEAFRTIVGDLPHPISVIVLPKPTVDKCKFEELKESLKYACDI